MATEFEIAVISAEPSTIVAVTCRVEYVQTRLAMMADLNVISSWVISTMYRTAYQCEYKCMFPPACSNKHASSRSARQVAALTYEYRDRP